MSESFAELLEESLANQKIKPGSIITGTVIDVNSDMVIVNAGLKSEAVIPAEQFFNDRGELEVQIGDEVEVALAIGGDDPAAFPAVHREGRQLGDLLRQELPAVSRLSELHMPS